MMTPLDLPACLPSGLMQSLHFQPTSPAQTTTLGQLETVASLEQLIRRCGWTDQPRPHFPQVWVWSRPQWLEFQIHLAWALLTSTSSVLCCAAKEHGSERLARWTQLSELIVDSQSKAHCRLLRLRALGSSHPQLQYWQDLALKGLVHLHPQTRRWTAPGIYGWEKVDVGSQLLCKHLPTGITGPWADFGCGSGILLQQLWEQNNYNRSKFQLHGLEVDKRALLAAEKNLAQVTNLRLHWLDITQMAHGLKDFQGVVTNPPFHRDTRSAISLGCTFLEKAAQALSPGGSLYLVANNSLPYESILQRLFSQQKELARSADFKILWAKGPQR